MKQDNHRSDGAWQVEPQQLKAAADALFHREPKLTPRLDKWTEDMPGIRDAQFAEPRLVRVNEINDTWLEIPRYENIMWVGGWIATVTSLVVFAIFFMFIPVFFPKE